MNFFRHFRLLVTVLALCLGTFSTNVLAQASQTISFGIAPTIAVGGSGIVSATATSGLPVWYSTLTPEVCWHSSDRTNVVIVSSITAGICTIAANQPGDTSYSAAIQVTQDIAIGNGVSQTINFGAAPNITVDGTGLVTATATSGLPVSYYVVISANCGPGSVPIAGICIPPPIICTISGSIVTGVSEGTCTIQAYQAGNNSYYPAQSVTQSFTIGAPAAATISDARVFAFAEANYPSIFASSVMAGAATTLQTTYQNVVYNYRYYRASGNYLAIDTTGGIFLIGPYSNNELMSIGPVESFRTPITAWEASVGLFY